MSAATVPPVLAIRGLTVRRGRTLLDRLDWTIRRGEHWALLGPNGCGKTSLLAALTGYLTPTAGEVRVLGEEHGRSDWRELRRRLGFVSNSLIRRIAPDQPAVDIVASGPAAELNTWHRPPPRERAAALRVLRRWRCADLADRPWGVLSQGERQRVLIARALHARPALLLLDEPCAGLDPIARQRLLELVEREARRRGGPSIVLVTHHVEEITPAFSHVLLLRAGATVASGPIRETLTSAQLGRAFGAPVRLRRSRAPRRYDLRVASGDSSKV